MNSKMVRWLLVANVIVLIGYISKTMYLKHQSVVKQQQIVEEVGASYEKTGTMTRQEYKTFMDVFSRVARTQHFSDSDFDWTVAAIQKSMQDPSAQGGTRRSTLLLSFSISRELTPEQQHKTYQLAVDLLNTGTDKWMAISLLGYSNDSRAIAYILPFQSSTDSMMRETAEASLQELGYKSAPAQ